MLAALLNGNKIIATDPAWDDRKEEYRAICNIHALCQICKEHVTCKFGQVKQHHFAHRCNSDCPGSNDTVEHMQGKTILHGFLKSRYGNQAKIEMEPYFEDIKPTGDILLEFLNGAKWAVEFACKIKKKDLQEKIAYYNRQDIVVTWILPKNILNILDNKYVRITRREQPLVVKTGLDKLYASDWYEQIVVDRSCGRIPTDDDSLGPLIFLDVEKLVLEILRAIQPQNHHDLFKYEALVQGPIEEVVIKATSNWGMVVSFPQEKALWIKYEEAKKIRLEIAKTNAQEVKIVPMDQKPGKFDYYVPPRVNKISSWEAGQGTLSKRHICPKCQ
ncbi:MAG: competence protein CoiA family protein [Desulfitobacteriaceae bacterium]|nr:competence protein CoiA family protein [Desulfitobacteriaceae bacterium]